MAYSANKYNIVQTLMDAVDSKTGGIRFAEGTTVPTDATAGYAKSAIFIHTDASGIADSLYVNVGTVSSCNFDPFPTTLTSDELAAIQGAATPTAANVFATMADVVAASVPADTIVNAQVNSSAAIDYSKMAALATGQLVVGNAGVPTATTVTGDVTIGATGVTAIGAGKVTSAMLAGSIDPSKVTLTDAHVVIGNGSNVGADVAITGDIGITNAGVTSISTGVIVNADVNASAAIGLTKTADDLTSFTGAVVPATDKIIINDNGTLKSGTYQVIMDGAADLTAKASSLAAADKVVITDSAASDVAKNITGQYLFDGIHNLTALGAAPDVADLIAVTDESAAGDPAKTVTVQNLFDSIGALTAMSGATVPGTDEIFYSDAGTVKRATLQMLYDGVNDLTAFTGAIVAATDNVLIDDGGVAKSCTYQVLMDGIDDLVALGAAPAITDTMLVGDAGVAKYATMQYIYDGMNGLTDAAPVITAAATDKIPMVDATDSAAKTITLFELGTALVGDGMAQDATSGQIDFAPTGLTEASIANGDYIVFADANDANAPKKEALADVATLFAGGGLTATNSVLAVCDTVWPMAAYGTWAVDGDAAETNGAGMVGDVTLTEAAAALCVVLDGAEYAPLSTCSSLGGVTSNYQLFPDAPAQADAVYFGHTVPFCEMAINMSATVCVYDAAAVIEWTYWNGATWAALTLAYDGTDSSDQSGQRPFQRDGAISFVPPSDWASTTVNAQAGYWIKAAIATDKAANMTTVGLTDSKEHEVVSPNDGFTCPAAGTINNIRAIDSATTLHTAADIKFVLMNFTTGANSGALTWAQDQRQDKWNIAAGIAVADGDELGVLITQEDGTNEALNVMLELEVTPS